MDMYWRGRSLIIKREEESERERDSERHGHR